MNFKDYVKEKKAKGLFVKIVDNPAIVIMAQNNGLDFIFYDCEHGVLSNEKLHDLMILANTYHFPSLVRVPQLSKSNVSKILDFGATGVMVPMIETKEEAMKLVQWSKYAPIGKRSYSGGANTHYGSSGNHEYQMKLQNERTMTIVQIETKKGVLNIDEILSVEGIDAAIIGPCDLGISIGKPDNIMDEELLSLISTVSQSCKIHNKSFGIIGDIRLLEYFKEEINLLVSAIDTNIIRNGIQKAVEAYQCLEK